MTTESPVDAEDDRLWPLRRGSGLKHFSFQDRASLCNSGYPGTHSLDQAGLAEKHAPASAS